LSEFNDFFYNLSFLSFFSLLLLLLFIPLQQLHAFLRGFHKKKNNGRGRGTSFVREREREREISCSTQGCAIQAASGTE